MDIEAFPERIFGPEHVKRHPDGSTESSISQSRNSVSLMRESCTGPHVARLTTTTITTRWSAARETNLSRSWRNTTSSARPACDALTTNADHNGPDAGRVPTDALVAQSQVSDCPLRLGRVLQTRGQSRELASVANGRVVPRPCQNGRETAVMSGHPTDTANGPGALLERPARLLPQDPSSVYGAYPGEFTEASPGITAQYGSTGLSRVGGDDQVVCAAGRTGSADMGEQASAVGRGRLRVVKDIDGGCYRHGCPGAFGCSVGRIGHLDADAVPGDRYRGDGKFVVIQ